MKCMKCGQSINGTIADSLSHVCVPRLKVEDDLERRNPSLQAARPTRRQDNLSRLLERSAGAEEIEPDEADEAYKPDDLDREIMLANQRDFGEGTEQEDRYRRRSLADEMQHERDLRDVEAEVPTDTYERAEFLAREMRFPSEQLARMRDKPLDHGLVSFQLMPAEMDEYLRTGKMPGVPEERRHYADKGRELVAQAPQKTRTAEGPSL